MHADRTLLTPVPAADIFVPMPDLIDAAGRHHPDRIALIAGDERVAWGALHEATEQVAAGLAGAGIGKGSRVAVLAATCPAYVEVYLGTLRAGACAVPLPMLAGTAALSAILTDCAPHAILADAAGRELLASATLPRSITLKLALDFKEPGWSGYRDWRDSQVGPSPRVAIAAEDPFNIIYSSGTTGTPKGIEQSHLMRSQHCARMGRLGLDGEARSLVSTPLYSNTTLVAALPTLAAGGSLVLMRRFDVAEFLVLSARERVTHAMLVPVQYRRILGHPDFGMADLSSYKVKFSTSAPFEPALLRQVVERWPGRMLCIYGLTEGGVTTILDATTFPEKLDTVGRPSQGTSVLTIDEEGRPLPAGETGEIVGRTTAIMTGYFGRRDLTEQVIWRDRDGVAWFRTGDLGFVDADGFLHLAGRRKDMIISGGFNIYPSDIEAVLAGHPTVAEVAVVGVPSAEWGETPVAFVVPRAGLDADGEALRMWANGRLGKLQRLSRVAVVGELPRSSIGKILKRELVAAHVGPPER